MNEGVREEEQPPALLRPALAELLLEPPASHGLLGLRPGAVCPQHQPTSQAALPTCPAPGHIHTHTHTYTDGPPAHIVCVCFMRMRHKMSSNKVGQDSVSEEYSEVKRFRFSE